VKPLRCRQQWRFSRAIGVYQTEKIDLFGGCLFVFDLMEGEGALIRMQTIDSRR